MQNLFSRTDRYLLFFFIFLKIFKTSVIAFGVFNWLVKFPSRYCSKNDHVFLVFYKNFCMNFIKYLIAPLESQMQLILVIYFHHEPHFSSPFITKGKPFPPTQTISRLRRCSVPIAELRKSVHSNRGSNLIKDASQDCQRGGQDQTCFQCSPFFMQPTTYCPCPLASKQKSFSIICYVCYSNIIS